MAKEATTEPGADAAVASGNMTLAQLGVRMTKGRKTASAPKPATAAAETATPETSSEQADPGAAQTDLSHPETEDSAALAAEATAEETNAEPAEATEEPAEAGTPNEEAEPPKAVRDLQKRVGKLTETRNELRAENAELKAQLLEVQKNAPPPKAAHVADGTFDNDRVVVEASETLAGVRAFLKWADANPSGGSFTEDGKTYELSAEDVQNYRRQSEEESIRCHTRREARLERLRADFDTRRAATHAEAVKLYPWIEQKSSPEFQEALAVIRESPAVLRKAEFELIVARQVAGQRLEREALKRAKAPAKAGTPNRAVTPVVTFSPTAARKPDGEKAATVSAAEKRFQDGGGRESDLSKLLAQKRLARLEAAKA